MKSFLEDLYYGKLYPGEQIVSNDPKYRALNREISEMMQMWRQKLSEEDFRQLEAMLDLQGESNSIHNMETFVQGFKLGASMMIEVWNGKE
ncbi:hypothetical protein QNH46_13890 [Paenibacillus woosongensis]|uniref:Uncharacterized protein n=1 Tax=Paenibacillus woosongensis TaxID=307580 RepID=A0A7X2Z4P0_9BACL|nr:DUF6809 family protein [Paenibacillus woosongensis]MUG47435.1 hypothetical protein [Paenibacillus woosongensis]WHX47259.1 hypothetical protein QNH46_13890 [Paenibacillus woosongensis]GIP59246.1 hypothetical protein J15TS10_30600 [Paenibacillus woosongensis]